jgi:osmotically-inducible protein OsmY
VGAAVLAVSLVGCSNEDKREAERKAAEAKKQAATAVEKAREQASEKAKEASKSAAEVAKKVGAEAKDVALKGASAAAAAGSEAAVAAGKASEVAAVRAAGALRTGSIRAALLREKSLDVSDVRIDTDEPAKRVVLTGRVKSGIQKAEIERIAKEKAPGYTLENRLVVRG